MIKLKNHPFSVEAFFKSSVVLTFAVKKDELNNLIPECLELDTFQEEWGFVAVAMVQTKNLRPKGFPAFLGNDFFLIGFRIFVKYQSNSGKTLRGLYIIKSETNKIRMQFFGNIFTHYNYTTTDIEEHEDESTRVIKSNKSDFLITIDKTTNQIEIPKGSLFRIGKKLENLLVPCLILLLIMKNQKKC